MAKLIAADQDYNSQSRILNLQAPASDNEPARLADLNSAVQGLGFKDNVRVATSSNINLASPGASLDGVTMAANDRVLVRGQTAAAENGIYLYDTDTTAMVRASDASTADELESAVVTVDEGTDGGTTWRQTAVNFTLDTDDVNWIAFGTTAPSASTTTPGLIEIATQAEVDAGTDAVRAITPATLASYSGLTKKATGAVGDGSATQFDITHNFGTRDIKVEVYRNSTPWDTIDCEVERPDTNTARVRFSAAPASNAYQVVVMG